MTAHTFCPPVRTLMGPGPSDVHQHGCLSVVDAVTALAGVPVEVDGWGIEAIYSTSQKCLSCTPGLAPVSFSEHALERVRNRTRPVQSWFLDLNLVLGYWGDGVATGKRAYHHTAPVSALEAVLGDMGAPIKRGAAIAAAQRVLAA